MKLAASIVTYHTHPDELANALGALASNGVGKVFVVDNSRSAQTAGQCEDYDFVEYIPSENRGYGAGHNQGLRMSLESHTDYHLVMNSDIDFSPGTLGPLLEYLDRHPEVGAVQPRIVGADGELQYTVRMLPTPLDLIGRRFLPRRLLSRRNERYELRHIDHSRAFDVPYHQGSFMLLRTDALRTVGLFDERYFMYPEDIDLTRRIHREYLTMYCPDSTVVHRHRQASYHSWRMTWIHCINMMRYFNKWGWLFDSERKMINNKLKRGE